MFVVFRTGMSESETKIHPPTRASGSARDGRRYLAMIVSDSTSHTPQIPKRRDRVPSAVIRYEPTLFRSEQPLKNCRWSVLPRAATTPLSDNPPQFQ
jgi:hypothetical protein